jgi:hypothetical protein
MAERANVAGRAAVGAGVGPSLLAQAKTSALWVSYVDDRVDFVGVRARADRKQGGQHHGRGNRR